MKTVSSSLSGAVVATTMETDSAELEINQTPGGAVRVPRSRAGRSLMSRLDGNIHKEMELSGMLQAAVEELGSQLRLDRSVMWLVDGSGELAYPAAQYCPGTIADVSGTISLPAFGDLAERLSKDQVLILPDAHSISSLRLLNHIRWPGAEPSSLICLPVAVDGYSRGILTLAMVNRTRQWSQDEIDLGRAVADRLALAIKHDDLVRQLQASAREADALYRASSLLIDTSDIDRLYEQILDAVADVFGHPNSNIWLIDEEREEAVLGYSRGDIPPGMPRSLRIDGPGLLARSVRTASIVNVTDAANEANYLPGLGGTRAELLVPLIVESKVIAVFNLESSCVGFFTARDERILSSFAERAARAVEQARMYNRMQEAVNREALVSRVTRLLNQWIDLESIFHEMVEELGRHLNAHRCFLAQIERRSGVVKITHQYASDGEFLSSDLSTQEAGAGYKAMGFGSLASGDVMLDPALLPSAGHFLRSRIRALLSTPVAQREGVEYVIVCTTEIPRKWSKEEIELVGALAGQAAIARQRAELFQEVTTSQREWEQTFDAMPEAVYVINSSLRLSRANLAAAALQGAASGRPTGLSCCEVMTLSGGFKECLIEQAIRLRHSIVREATPKLAGRPFLFTIEPTYSRNGSAMGAIVIASDLTAIKHAEAEAQKQREFLSSLVEIAHDAIVVLDGKGKLSWSNLRLSELSGYRWDELRGKRLSELITVDEAGPSLVRLESPSELPESFEARLVREDGTSRYVLVTTTPILDSGRFSGVLGILHDITGVKNSAEKAAQTEKLRALGQLAGGVAHNFNNLLAAVLGHAQLLKRHLTAHPLAGHVELIERAAMDGAAMVRRINSFSLRGSEESFAVTELSGVVRDSLEMTRIRWQDDARAQGLSYQIDFHPVEPETVLGSASELREVFVDMIFNALDAMSSKGGRLTIETGHDATGAYVRFADEGVGMSAGVIEHVFDPFFTTKGAAGTGLGLSGSYAIVERHGGRIEVESQPGRGATFTVRVPRCGAATDMQVQRKDEDQEGTGVLILDDDGELGEKLASVINSWGVDAILTRRSGHALEKLQTGCYAVALISLHLPEGNLSALADEIRSIAPTTKVLIIADSAVSIRGTGRSPSNIGAIITRPFKEETVLLALERALLDA